MSSSTKHSQHDQIAMKLLDGEIGEQEAMAIKATCDAVSEEMFCYLAKGSEKFKKFRENTEHCLRTMSSDKLGAEIGLADLINTLRSPSGWKDPTAWLIFWTAMAASLNCKLEAADREIEDSLTFHWLTGWKNQIEKWKGGLEPFICTDPAYIYGITAGGDGETESGGDVFVVLCLEGPTGSISIRLANIQFKRTPFGRKTAKLPVDYKNFDQLHTATKHHAPLKGATSLYGMFSQALDLLELVAGIDVDLIATIIEPGLPDDPENDAPLTLEKSLAWQQHAESMPAVLAKTLGTPGDQSGFRSLDDLITWLDAIAKENGHQTILPEYWIVQCLRDRSYAAKFAINDAYQDIRNKLVATLTRFGLTELSLDFIGKTNRHRI